MITLKDAINNNVIDNNSILYSLRCKCGKPLCFSDSFKTMYCSDNKCKFILVNRIIHICSKLNIEISTDVALELIDTVGIITPFQIFVIDELYTTNKLNIQNAEELVNKVKLAKSKKYKIYNIAEMTGIAEIDNIAKDIFFGFNSFDEAYNFIESGQVAFINDRLGLKSQDSNAISLEIYNKLLSVKDELQFAEIKLNIEKYSNTLKIVIDSDIEPFINATEFIEYLNSKYKYTFVIVSSISDSTDILIRVSNNSNKCKLANYINDKNIANAMNNNIISYNDISKFVDGELKPVGHKIFITTVDELISRLEVLNG